MLSEKELWLTEEERSFIRKKIVKNIYQELDKIGKELRFQPANKVYINLHFNNIKNYINKVV